MADFPIDRPWQLIIPEAKKNKLFSHLFPGDGREHAAAIFAGVHVLPDRVRLLVRDIEFAEDGIDHIVGPRGHLTVRAQFVQRAVKRAREQRLMYLSVHNHDGWKSVSFSQTDIASHEYGYPTLLRLTEGMPVGALVFAREAVAGDLWMPNCERVQLQCASIVGASRKIITAVERKATFGKNAPIYNRQVMLFGERGQSILAKSVVAIIGVGGVGSILAELLSRLGVQHFILIDPDRADVTNVPRLVGAKRSDVLISEEISRQFGILKPILDRFRRRKVDLAARNILRANPRATIKRIADTVANQSSAEKLLGCDYVFLAADSMLARLVFNAVVHQYLIPGVQVGARVMSDEQTGVIDDVYSVIRPLTTFSGCLRCNSLINPTKLQIEATTVEQARAQRYGTESPAPSVISLNAQGAAEAVLMFQNYMTGLSHFNSSGDYVRFHPLRRSVIFDEPSQDEQCTECGTSKYSRLAKGDSVQLPTI